MTQAELRALSERARKGRKMAARQNPLRLYDLWLDPDGALSVVGGVREERRPGGDDGPARPAADR